MLLTEIAEKLNLNMKSSAAPDVEVTAGYVSDLLSDVLANAKAGALWVTNQRHQNVVGVCVMLDLAGVVMAGGIEPDENAVEKAREENVPLYTTDESAFDVIGRLYELGIRSSR